MYSQIRFFTLLYVLYCVFFSTRIQAQTIDVFSDFSAQENWNTKLFSSGDIPSGNYLFLDNTTIQSNFVSGSGQRKIDFLYKNDFPYSFNKDTLEWLIYIKHDFSISSSLQKTNYSSLLLFDDLLEVDLGSYIKVRHLDQVIFEIETDWIYQDWNTVEVQLIGHQFTLKVNDQLLGVFDIHLEEGAYKVGLSSLFTSSSRGNAFFYKDFSFKKKIKQVDLTPPKLVEVSFLDHQQIKLKFDEPIFLDCGDVSQFNVSDKTLDSVFFDSKESLVLLLQNGLQESDAITISFSYLCDENQNILLPSSFDTVYTDSQPPKIVQTSILTPFSVSLEFSEAIELSEVYGISFDGYQVKEFSINEHQMILYFEETFPENTVFDLTLSGISDHKGNVLNTSINVYYDTQKPKIVAYDFHPPNQFYIKFSEEVKGLEDRFNYALYNTAVSEVKLISSQEILLSLDMEALVELTTYTLQVKNIEDLQGNVMNNRYLKFVYDITPPNVETYIKKDSSAFIVFSEEIISCDSIFINNTLYEYDWSNCGKKIIQLPIKDADVLKLIGLKDENDFSSDLIEEVIFSDVDSLLYQDFESLLDELSIIDHHHVVLRFKEAIEKLDFLEAENIQYQFIDDTQVYITLKDELQNNVEQILTIKSGRTCSGYLIKEHAISFQWDNVPPKVKEVELIDRYTVSVIFSELINEESLINGRVTIEEKEISEKELEENTLRLDLSSPINYGEMLALVVHAGVEDVHQNKMQKDTICSIEVPTLPEIGSIVLNELMIDPTPSIGSPNAEFIELHNPTTQGVSLFGGYLMIDEKKIKLPHRVVKAGEFLVFTKPQELFLFVEVAHVLPLENFSGLLNSKGSIQLWFDDQMYDEVSYPMHFNNQAHLNGGQSLERIDPHFFCDAHQNWKSCQHSSGSTVGVENSIFALLEDSQPIEIDEIKGVGARTIQVKFNKKVLGDSVNSTSNYSLLNVDNSVNNLEIVDNYTLNISFDHDLPTGMLIFLTVDNFVDCFSNFQFYYQKPFVLPQKVKYQQMLVSELMIDHSPIVKMPETEYIEIHNTSNDYLYLSECRMLSNGDTIDLPNDWIIPGGYVVLCDQDAENLFDKDIQVIGVDNFPILRNDEGYIQLINTENELVDEVFYDIDQLDDSQKKEGGWSMERIDVSSDCFSRFNWTYSDDERGGTAGEENSVNYVWDDKQAPSLENAISIEDTVVLFFDEEISINKSRDLKINYGSSVYSLLDVEVDDQIISFVGDGFTNEHQIMIEGVSDCFGNSERQEIKITPLNLDSHSLHLSEILYDPSVLNTDFVELYNASDLPVLLNDWVISNGSESKKIISETKYYLIHPHSWVVLTSNKEYLMSYYPSLSSESVIEMSLPSFPNAGGTLSLWYKNEVREKMNYGDQFHQQYIRDTEDVSLERISYNDNADLESNWTSATESAGYATPGEKNSRNQFSKNEEGSIGGLTFSAPIITPNEDGENDFLEIRNTTESALRIYRMEVFDLSGKLVKQLVQNYTLAAGDAIKWDGEVDSRERMYGQFIVYVHIENQFNSVETYAKVIRVATWY
ncbi:hypothetical protein MY04_3285 [Flammeovirga sp. MY04]|uniref:gliding motility-associated C-terminal domain-containing protein n=1 Tax=Flammeovirga sp. MY04 TaxID=1191459 RepID=UPI00080622AD|nr:gliding motility-associated C-terminal domain-containing protein [Flammeovirga sp. MY04]ANQ50647.1 hypothetical protein MY04_3285 [Flammeovirga sp. MY04]